MIVATKNALDENQMVKQLAGRLGYLSADDKSTILDGAITFRSFCANCHGKDGKGLATGDGTMAAPPLVGANPFEFSEKYTAIRLLLNGLTGRLNGKTYPGEMPSMAANSDRWISQCIKLCQV